MRKIESFQVNHDTLQKGMYISRVDQDIVTYDIRMKVPNTGDYLDNAVIHTFEHLFATYIRNSKWAESIVYVGPMGCLTGFYLLVRDSISHEDAITLMQESCRFISSFESEIPGAEKVECGNYLLHDLQKAKALAADFAEIIVNWTVKDMRYT